MCTRLTWNNYSPKTHAPNIWETEEIRFQLHDIAHATPNLTPPRTQDSGGYLQLCKNRVRHRWSVVLIWSRDRVWLRSGWGPSSAKLSNFMIFILHLVFTFRDAADGQNINDISMRICWLSFLSARLSFQKANCGGVSSSPLQVRRVPGR
jgi:hypothetical protein